MTEKILKAHGIEQIEKACSECGTAAIAIMPDHNFCWRCGKELEIINSAQCECGAPKRIAGTFCPFCGRQAG